jgi:uncharacterized membrane protein (UPF0127 family)
MKNAERIVIVAILLLLVGVGGWGYYAVQDKRADYRERVANGDFEIRPSQQPLAGLTATTSDQSNWRSIYPNTVPIKIGAVLVQASIADTMTSRIKGLSNTPYLPANVVKLFAFGVSGSHSIWMKDMLYPIDIIWAAEDGVIVHIEENVSPESFPNSFASPKPAWFVIETNAGFVTDNEIVIGDRVVLPVAQ